MNYMLIKTTFGTPGVDTAREQVIGRNVLVAEMWRILEGSSIRLLSERRMGKTWLLRLAVAEAACQVPFYIQHIVKRMREQREHEWTVSSTRRIPGELFTAPGDPAEFKYYDSRLDQYYPADVVERSRVALDILSRERSGFPFHELLNLIRHSPKTLMLDGAALLDILQILRDDHYLVQEGERWRFKLEIVRRWWHQYRGGLGL